MIAGSNVSLTCSAVGFHLPNISWSVPDPLNDRITISRTVINDSFTASQLYIFNTEQRDTGNFSCTAENGISNDTGYIFLQVLGMYSICDSERHTLTMHVVICISFHPSEPAMIVNHTQELNVVIADSVTVYCEVTGVYRPSIMWTRDDDNETQTVQNTSRVTISESVGANGAVISTLTIDVITRSDAGIYSCRVANSAGNDEASFQLNIQGRYSYMHIQTIVD